MDGKACNWYDCNTIEISCKAKVPRQRTLSRPPPRPCTATTAVAAPVSTGGPVLAAPARVGCLGSGAPSTTYKPRAVAYSKPTPIDCVLSSQPNQHTKSFGHQQTAGSFRANDAGGVELQPRPLGTMSGGEGQAGWACEFASQQEMVSKQRNVQSKWIVGMWVGGRRTTLDLSLGMKRHES